MNYSEHYAYKRTVHQEGVNASKREGRGRGSLSVGYDQPQIAFVSCLLENGFTAGVPEF